MKKLASLLLLCASVSAFADDGATKDTNINYNEVALGYFSMRISNAYDFTGYAVKGAALVTDSIFIDGTYNSGSYSTSTLTFTEANVGYRYPIGSSTDGIASIGYTGFTFTGDDASNGYNIKFGVISKLTDDIKLSGAIKYTKVTNNDPYSTGTLDAQYNFTKSFFSNISYNSMSGGSTSTYYIVGVGYNF